MGGDGTGWAGREALMIGPGLFPFISCPFITGAKEIMQRQGKILLHLKNRACRICLSSDSKALGSSPHLILLLHACLMSLV